MNGLIFVSLQGLKLTNLSSVYCCFINKTVSNDTEAGLSMISDHSLY